MTNLSQILFRNSNFTIVQPPAAQLQMTIIQYDVIRLSVSAKSKNSAKNLTHASDHSGFSKLQSP
jgi:hypothetical protein